MKLPALLLCTLLAMATPPGNAPVKKRAPETQPPNAQRWATATLRPAWIPALDKAIWHYQRSAPRYLAIQRLRPRGMPAPIIAAIHGRESSWDFTCHLHEGSPLTHRTRYVPRGRPLTPDPPYTFEQSAEDALYLLKSEHLIDWTTPATALDAIESYNGLGYRRYHPDVPSPYLWSGTTLYSRGKFVADHRFSPTAVDRQAGVAAILIRMKERGMIDSSTWSK
ncbi:MAG: hypothetical protein QM755_02720 [Luteolibacter sp.]